MEEEIEFQQGIKLDINEEGGKERRIDEGIYIYIYIY